MSTKDVINELFTTVRSYADQFYAKISEAKGSNETRIPPEEFTLLLSPKSTSLTLQKLIVTLQLCIEQWKASQLATDENERIRHMTIAEIELKNFAMMMQHMHYTVMESYKKNPEEDNDEIMSQLFSMISIT